MRQLPARGTDPLSREAAVRTPFHALITTGQRQEKQDFLLYRTEAMLQESPVGLRPRAIVSECNGIHSVFKSFRN